MTSRKRYRPRPVTLDTMALATHRAAKPAAGDVAHILQGISQAFTALRQGVATEHQWSILAGSLAVSQAIERQGVVRGLREHLASAGQALQGIYQRAMAAGEWHPTALYYQELDVISAFVGLHKFQLKQLSTAELLAAVDLAQGQIRSNGGTVQVVRDLQPHTGLLAA